MLRLSRRSRFIRNLVVIGAALGLTSFGFQNCSEGFHGSSQASFSSSDSDDPSNPTDPTNPTNPNIPLPPTSPPSSSNSVYTTVAEVDQAAPAAATEVLSDAFQKRGVCAIRGGAGKYLIRSDFTSQATCQNKCSQLASFANRTCTWKGAKFFGDPQQSCTVQGGAHAILESVALATFGQCQTLCNNHASSTYRLCDWGSARFQQPGNSNLCRVIGGAGAMLLNPPAYGSMSDCQNFCTQYSSNTYRTCIYGSVAILQPPESSKCQIWGGAGVTLTAPFYGSQADCANKCATFSSNPNRTCYYGKGSVK